MKILAVDTATNSCSVAVADYCQGLETLAELTVVSKQTHSKHLMEMINTAARMSGIAVSELDGFAVTRGPGSFTGLRIGISTVKGLAFASGKPVVGISNLDALAFRFLFSPYLICTLLDARKGEVYYCCYRTVDGIVKKQAEEQVLSPGKAVSGINEPCLFVGSGAFLYQKLISDKAGELAHFAPACHNTIHASTVAHLSMERFEKNDTDDVATLVPHYIRESDAELSFGKR
ncbi:MAG: tRNA (adenosine(37)-N6)-threonylcarbamoyltransferase complex dimerization subunit type 1 TsaB [Desulfobacterales bacterium]|nr:tRNA (adenosine(37)-N6)-threonylcarbamoyltransferase complex dimerization subunit type 1 TsaB [Desulfobacterales bacterium]